jgi:hypothetical protein
MSAPRRRNLPRERFSPRRRLHRVQRLALLRGKSVLPTGKKARRLWALGSAALLILAVLVLTLGKRYTAQKLDVEENLRAQIIPALEKELGQKIEVGKIESDYFSRLVLRDIVIGRNKNSPIGALAKAKTVTIYLDAVQLVTHRAEPLQAISKITLDAPQVFVSRDKNGKFNVGDLFKKRQQTSQFKWHGLAEINDGRFYLRDALTRSAGGQPLILDAQQLRGWARFDGNRPVRYSLNLPRSYVGKNRVLVRGADIIGSAALNGKWFAFDANWPAAPAPLLSDWAFRKREVVAQSGTIAGHARLMWEAELPREEQLFATGVLTLRGVSGYAAKTLEPGTQKPLQISNAGGAVKFNNHAIETGGVQLTALNTPLRVAGKFSFKPALFDIRATSQSFNAARLIEVLRAVNRTSSAPNAELAAMTLRASNPSGQVRLTGDAKNYIASGKLIFDQARFSHPKWGAGSMSTPGVNFTFATQNRQTQLNADYTAARGEYSSTNFGNWQAAGNLQGNVRWSNNAGAPQLQARLITDSLSGNSARYGAWRVGGVNILARQSNIGARGNAPLLAQIRATKVAGRHPRAGTLGARGLSATVNLSKTPDAFFASGTAQSALGSDAKIESLRGLSWQTGAVAATINARGASGTAQIQASAARARQAKFGAAQAGTVRANVSFDTARGASTFSSRFSARNTRLQNAEAGRWRAQTVVGIASARTVKNATPIQLDIEARSFSGAHNRYGKWSGNALRVAASTPDAPRAGWDGVAALGQTDVSDLNTAALSPAVSERVCEVGVLTGKARFLNLGRDDAIVKGRARLSQLTLKQNGQSYPLRNIETSIAFGGEQLRLAGLRAQSEFGPLQADAQSVLSGGSFNAESLKLTLVAPRVTVSGVQINPYLKTSGVRVQGNAVGRVQISTNGLPKANAANPTLQTRFDFSVPSAQISVPQTSRSQPIRLAAGRLQGAGNLNFTSAKNWSFSGNADFSAKHLAAHFTQNANVQNANAQNVRAADLQLAARGTLAQSAEGFEPRVQGELRAASLLWPLNASQRQSTANREIFALQNVRAVFNLQPQLLQIARFEAGAGKGSKLIGHVALRQTGNERFGFDGQMLLEKFDAARAQSLLEAFQSKTSQSDNRVDDNLPQFGGTLFARADFSGDYNRGALAFDNVGLQARLYQGRMAYQENLLPIDAARFHTTLQFPWRDNAEIPIHELNIWSRGARLAASGVLRPESGGTTPGNIALDLNATLNTLRLEHLSNVSALRPALAKMETNGELSGLVSAQIHIGGTLGAPQLQGRAALKLAQAFGAEIENVSGNVRLETQADTNSQWPDFQLSVSNIEGQAEGADFSGLLTADSRKNNWRLALQTDAAISMNRLRSVAQARDDVRLRGWRDLPLRGDIGGKLTLTGTLHGEDGASGFAISNGEANLSAGTLTWRGRELGQLAAALDLRGGALLARRFELVRTGEKTNGRGSDAQADAARLRITGVLPVALDAPDLSAQVSIKNERLSFVIEVMEEIRQSLAQRGQSVAYLDTILKRLSGLPADVEGRFDMQANLEQSWRAPIVEVRSLQARDIYIQTDSGQTRRLPDVTARFTYDAQDNGAIALQSAELRLPAPPRRPQLLSDDGDDDENAAGDTGAEDDESDEDLLIRTLRPGRIVPGGALNLTAEILNADLQQLAQWLPGLRDENGLPAIKGRLSDFVVQLAGTTERPTVTGSLQGENWDYRGYSLDRVRLSQFSIADDKLQIERGALTVVKGDFQSDAAWGFLPWTWSGANGEETGISYTRPMKIHLAMDEKNFGALAGIFVPQIVNVSAQDFAGEAIITGTLNAPQLAGSAQITNGAFRWRSSRAELDAGVQDLNGELRFAPGNRLEIVGNGLRGQLVSADAVQAPTTGNEGTPARQERDAKRKDKNPPPRIDGDFVLRGDITLDLDPQIWRQPRLATAQQRYNLKFALINASYQTPNFSGVRDVQAFASWTTGAGTARENQNVQWAFSANGNTGNSRKGKNKNGDGRVLSFASLALPPNFAVSVEDLLKARAETFPGAAAFADVPELKTQSAFLAVLQKAGGNQSAIRLDNFKYDWKNVARGILNGEITLDNLPAAKPVTKPFPTPQQRPARARQAIFQQNKKNAGAKPIATESAAGSTPDPASAAASSPATRPPLRLEGTLAMEQTEIYGPPETRQNDDDGENDGATGSASSSSAARGVLSNLPSAPALAIKLVAGSEVQFVSSNLRATISGDIDFGGTPHDPIVFGTLFTRNGNITFPNARARLESGEITISARRDPITDMLRTRVEVDVTARGRSGRYDITLRVRGPLDTGEGTTQDLRVDISSNPPLSTDEAFAQLLGTSALGRANADDQQEAYARALVGFLSGPLFSGLERTLEKTLGLDSIALDYRVDEPIGIEIGKAIGDRLYVSYRRSLSRGVAEKTPFDLRIDYRIKGDLQIGVETDETDTRRVTIRKSWRF